MARDFYDEFARILIRAETKARGNGSTRTKIASSSSRAHASRFAPSVMASA
jgi:hypothetical protein